MKELIILMELAVEVDEVVTLEDILDARIGTDADVALILCDKDGNVLQYTLNVTEDYFDFLKYKEDTNEHTG